MSEAPTGDEHSCRQWLAIAQGKRPRIGTGDIVHKAWSTLYGMGGGLMFIDDCAKLATCSELILTGCPRKMAFQ